MNTKYFIVNGEQKYVAPYIQKWGRAPSIALLDYACQIFYDQSTDGIIGYRIENGCVLIFGDPLCSQKDRKLLVETFHAHFAKKYTTIIYLLASEEFKQFALEEKYVKAAMNMGDEIVLDPQYDPKLLQGRRASVLRNQYNQAQRSGLLVKEYADSNSVLEHEMQQVGLSWLNNRRGPQTSLLSVDIFSDRSNKRWFYATYNNHIVSVFVLNKLELCQGWAINMLLMMPDAPKYSSEFLLLTVLDVLRFEKCYFISLGTLPSTEITTIEGFGRLTTFFAQYSFKISQKIFKLNKRQQYWQKFDPTKKTSYLLLNKSHIGIREGIAIMKAFNVKL